MKVSTTTVVFVLMIGVGLAAAAPAARLAAGEPAAQSSSSEAQQRAQERDQRAQDRERELYDRGQDALERSEWTRAVERFQQIVALQGARADAALYWKAYALDRLGQQAEALAAVAELAKGFPKSRWLSDAKALEIQVRQSVGQPVRPENQADEELKLLALNALQHSDPELAMPMLRQILQGTQSIKLKERALFVLAQSRSVDARNLLADVARGASNPDLQRKAIDYLGVHGSAENRALLAEIYQSSSDVDVKRRILRAFMVSGERQRLLAAATGEKEPALRAEAVRQLGVMGAHDELWQLYQKEASVDVKTQILQAMFVGGNATRLIELATSEPNADLRLAAIRGLGLMGASQTGQALVTMYGRDTNTAVRMAIINALFLQNNAESLVAIARKETDQALKKELVRRLSQMQSKVALDYLMELLGK
jgi:HEAT repeats